MRIALIVIALLTLAACQSHRPPDATQFQLFYRDSPEVLCAMDSYPYVTETLKKTARGAAITGLVVYAVTLTTMPGIALRGALSGAIGGAGESIYVANVRHRCDD